MSEETVTKSKWTTRRKVLAAFLAMVGISTMVIMPTLFWELHAADKALHGFCDALIAKQYKPAYDFTSKEFQASVDFQKFTKVHDDLTARMGDLKSIEITHSEVKDRSDGWYPMRPVASRARKSRWLRHRTHTLPDEPTLEPRRNRNTEAAKPGGAPPGAGSHYLRREAPLRRG